MLKHLLATRPGFKKIKRGVTANVVHRFEADEVTNLYSVGGSFLRTSRETLQSAQEVDNVLRVFEHLRVRYLVVRCVTLFARCVRWLTCHVL